MTSLTDNPVKRRVITRDAVAAELRRLAETMPDQVNPHDADLGSCVYDDGNGNHCIVGQVLVNLVGYLPDPLDYSQVAGPGTVVAEYPVSVEFEGSAVRLLNDVQTEADGGQEGRQIPWARAVREVGLI